MATAEAAEKHGERRVAWMAEPCERNEGDVKGECPYQEYGERGSGCPRPQSLKGEDAQGQDQGMEQEM